MLYRIFEGKMEVKDSEDETDDTEMGEAGPLPHKVEKHVPGPEVKEFVQKLKDPRRNLPRRLKANLQHVPLLHED